jgi:drug/metabolite transporter (DMT)-like permease
VAPHSVRDRFGEGLALVLLSTVAYGGMPIFAKLAYAGGAGSATVLSYRFVIATAVFALMARGKPPLPWSSRLLLWGLGVVFMANALSYFKALETTPASVVAVILYTYPVWVTLLSAAAGLEALTVRSLLTASLAVAGCALAGGARLQSGDVRGVVFSLVSSVIYASYVVLGSRFASSLPAEAGARHVAQACAVLSVPWAAAAGGLHPPRTVQAWAAILAIALLCTIVAFRTFLAGLARVGPVTAALVSSFEVVVTMVLATVFLGERPGRAQLAGATLILGAVLLQNARRLTLTRASRAA